MSNREKCYSIIDSFTDEQLSNIVVLLASAKNLSDESADDAYCMRLYFDYQADPDNNESVDIETFAKGLGISL